MNVLILGFHYNNTVVELKKLHTDWNIVWIATEQQRKEYVWCESSYENLQRGCVGKTTYSGAYSEQYQKVFDQFLYYLRMMTRVTGEGWVDWTFSDYINLFNLQFDFFARLFLSHNTKLLLLSTFAHEGFDCIPYLLAKALGIKTLIPLQSPFPSRFFCVTSVESYGRFDTVPFFEEPQPYKIEKQHFKPHPYLVFRPEYGIDFNTAKKLWYLFWDKGPARLLMRYYRLKNYNRMVSKLCREETDTRFDVPYVYFPLHMQPELTTTSIGGIYEDQMLAIERLSKRIPDGWMIYVKENFVQTEQHRGMFFFQRLQRLPNVCLISRKINTFKLIENSKFVATITGTVGWEAITGGKNVLVFGHTWYRTLPGVFEFSDTFCTDEIMAYQIDHNELEKKTGEMIAKMLPGIVEKPYEILCKDFDADQNATLVAQGLTRYVQHVMS
jgi:hypothetical protein